MTSTDSLFYASKRHLYKEPEWAFVWRNWIKSGHYKASEIDYERNGHCDVYRLRTNYGEIVCVINRSGIVMRVMRRVITGLYRLSNEPVPVFVSYKIFKLIEAIERG